MWDDPEVLPWIEANISRIVGVHISDWPALDRADRVLPTEGISHTLELVAALVLAGWDGALDVEIFSTPDLFWGLPVDEAARRAYAAAALRSTDRPVRTPRASDHSALTPAAWPTTPTDFSCCCQPKCGNGCDRAHHAEQRRRGAPTVGRCRERSGGAG